MMALCLKKPWAGLAKESAHQCKSHSSWKTEKASPSAYVTIYACYERVGYAGISICFTLYRKIVKFSKSCFHLLFLNSREIRILFFHKLWIVPFACSKLSTRSSADTERRVARPQSGKETASRAFLSPEDLVTKRNYIEWTWPHFISRLNSTVSSYTPAK